MKKLQQSHKLRPLAEYQSGTWRYEMVYQHTLDSFRVRMAERLAAVQGKAQRVAA